MATDHLTVFGTDGRPVLDLEQLSVLQRVAYAVQAAWQVGLWQQLQARGPASAKAVAEACGTDPALTERLLFVLAATGYAFRQPDGLFRLTEAGRAAFDPDSPVYYGDGLGHAAGFAGRWQQLVAQLRPTGEEQPSGPSTMSEDALRVFVMAMQDYSIRGRAQWLAGNLPLLGRLHLLDLGGGPGTYTAALLEANPGLRATIFDRPATEPLARANLARYGLTDRLAFRAGNFDTDDLGSGYDCALASNVLHGAHTGSAARLARLVGALEPGALVAVQDFVLDDDGNGPLEAAMFGLHVGAYRVGEMLAIMADAGLERAALSGRGPAGAGLFVGFKCGA